MQGWWGGGEGLGVQLLFPGCLLSFFFFLNKNNHLLIFNRCPWQEEKGTTEDEMVEWHH